MTTKKKLRKKRRNLCSSEKLEATNSGLIVAGCHEARKLDVAHAFVPMYHVHLEHQLNLKSFM